MDNLWADLRYAVRGILKSPGFTATAVAVLALGIGANTAMFTLINAFLIRPIVAQNPEELAGCYSKDAKTGDYRAFSCPDYFDLRENNTSFSRLAAHDVSMVGLTEGETTRRVFADFVSANYLATFGIRPVLGRDFTKEEEDPQSAPSVVIVDYKFWEKNGQGRDFLGKTLRINGRLLTVIGIAPEGFTGTAAMFGPELYLPLGLYDSLAYEEFAQGKKQLGDRNHRCLVLVGRLKPGTTVEGARSELAVIAARMEKEHPVADKDQTFTVHPVSRLSISTSPQDDGELSAVAILLMLVASVVLLIACLNLANMLLARGSSRRKEFAIRIALGAGRGRILRQLLTEGLLLSAMGGIAGMLLAFWGVRILIASMTAMSPIQIVFHAGPDSRVLGALVAFCVASTVIAGLGPALRVSRLDVVSDLKDNIRGETGMRRSVFPRRNLLIVGQISLSLTLLVAAGLFIRGALEAARVDLGFSLARSVQEESGSVRHSGCRGKEPPASRWRSQIVPLHQEESGSVRHSGCRGKEPEENPDRKQIPRPAGNHPRNYSWAELMKRVWDVDVLKCDRCGGPMRVLCAITAPDAIVKILDCLGLPSRPPPVYPAAQDFYFGD